MRALRAFAPAAPAVTGPHVRRHRLARLPPLRFRVYVRAEEVACGESSEIREEQCSRIRPYDSTSSIGAPVAARSTDSQPFFAAALVS